MLGDGVIVRGGRIANRALRAAPPLGFDAAVDDDRFTSVGVRSRPPFEGMAGCPAPGPKVDVELL